MSTFAKLEENYDSKETLVDTIKTDLVSQFKMCVDDWERGELSIILVVKR